MNNYKLYIKIIVPPIIFVSSLALMLALLPVKNIISINLQILLWVLLYDIYQFVEPEPKRWATKSLYTILWTTLFILLTVWLGVWGIVGTLLIICLLAGFRIYSNYALYDYYTTWAAKRLFKGSKEEFDITKVNDDGQTRSDQKQDERISQ